jgi:hypothetical protein
MHHHWDLFAPLLCYVANPWLDKRHSLTIDKVHPFLETKATKAKAFNRDDWKAFGAEIRGETPRILEK